MSTVLLNRTSRRNASTSTARLQKIELLQKDHSVILNASRVQVTNFSYDGLAPAVHWWGAKSLGVKDLK